MHPVGVGVASGSQVACRNLKEALPERDDLEFRAMMIYKHIIICQQVTTVGRSDK